MFVFKTLALRLRRKRDRQNDRHTEGLTDRQTRKMCKKTT